MKEIVVSISERALTLELGVKDKDLIDALLLPLRNFVTAGDPIKVRQTYMNSPSDSLRIMTSIISDARSMDKWINEIGQLISVLQSHS